MTTLEIESLIWGGTLLVACLIVVILTSKIMDKRENEDDELNEEQREFVRKKFAEYLEKKAKG